MPLVRYTGRSHFRVLAASDAKRATPPVDDFTKTTWARGETQEVSDAASEWLIRDLSDEFSVEENKPKVASPSQAPAKSSSKPS